MPAIKFSEMDLDDDRYTINYYANIDKSVRIEPYVIIEEEVEIGKDTIIGPFNQIRSKTKIGKNCKIGGHCTFEGNNIIIGDNVRIGTHVNLGWNTYVGDNTFIGNYFIPANDNNINWPPKSNFKPERTYIGKNVKIGICVTFLPGITVGDNAFVGARSLITKDVPSNSVVYGSPAKVVNRLSVK